jgi:hypothetical protein
MNLATISTPYASKDQLRATLAMRRRRSSRWNSCGREMSCRRAKMGPWVVKRVKRENPDRVTRDATSQPEISRQ